MVIGVARVVLHLPASRSLKDKRQVLKPLIVQIQRQFHLSVAEVERQDQWQIGVIGLVCVSTTPAQVDKVLANAVTFLASRAQDADLLDYATEVIQAL